MCIVTDGSETPLPEGSELLTDNSISIVWRGHDGYIYKRSIPFLIENEIFFLDLLSDSGFVPSATRIDKYTIRMEDLGETEKVDDVGSFSFMMGELYGILQKRKIRHGDLTKYSIIVKNNRPYLIDFAESRLFHDPRDDKRPEGDGYWIQKTMVELCAHLT